MRRHNEEGELYTVSRNDAEWLPLCEAQFHECARKFLRQWDEIFVGDLLLGVRIYLRIVDDGDLNRHSCHKLPSGKQSIIHIRWDITGHLIIIMSSKASFIND